MNEYCKRLIEVDLPIKRISVHARREKSIRHGHISTLHIWWARRPLAACRAVICASLWPDPADEKCPERFRKTAREQMTKWAKDHLRLLSEESWTRFVAISKDERKLDDPVELRGALLDFITDFSNWDNSTKSEYLETSRLLTQSAHEALGGEAGSRPLVVDPFAGGGSIPLEALRVGADAFASDLNPVPVLLNKVMLEYIPKYGQRLADEVRMWGKRIKEKAEKELAGLYPNDPDGAIPTAYIWARTIQCEGPSCGAWIPLLRSTLLSKRSGREAFIQLSVDKKKCIVNSKVVFGVPSKNDLNSTVSRGKPTCPVCGYTTSLDNVKKQFRSRNGGTLDARLMAVVLNNGLFHDPGQTDKKAIANAATKLDAIKKEWNGDLSFVPNEDTTHYHTFVNRASVYGLSTWEDFYTIRQRLVLGTLCQLVSNLDLSSLQDSDFEKAVRTLLAFSIDRGADYWSSLATWAGDFVAHTFGRQALPFVWDFAEVNPFAEASGNFAGALDWIARVVERESISHSHPGQVLQGSATELALPDDSASAVITDPPYYYAIQYADLSDYFYVWLRRSLGSHYPSLLSNDETPKQEEAIVQSPGDQDALEGKNREHYERIMRKALLSSRRVAQPNGVAVIVFANATTAGWESLLDSAISQGWVITASWPIDTERPGRVISSGRAVLASSVHLVCRPRENPDGSVRTDDVGNWRDVLEELPKRIHEWMPRLAEEGVVGADAIFACLGPALEIYSKYSSVEKASGEQVLLKEYLIEVWAAVSREALDMIFRGADASGFEEDARITAMWLWTLHTESNGNSSEENKVQSSHGYSLEYDAARKIAQGLGVHLENMTNLIDIKGDTATLLPVAGRTRYLFGKDADEVPKEKKKKKIVQQSLFDFEEDLKEIEKEAGKISGELSGKPGTTVLDQLHQCMLLFAAGRGEAMKRLLVEEGIGRNPLFWRLAQALSALYPSSTDEKRWVDGVLARKKGLGL